MLHNISGLFFLTKNDTKDGLCINFVLCCAVVLYGFMKLTYVLNAGCSKLYGNGIFHVNKFWFLFIMLY